MQNLKITAVAMAVSAAAYVSTADAATQTVSNGAIVQIGCSVPSASGASVYSIDASTANLTAGAVAYNTVGIPTSIVAGTSCSAAVSTMQTSTTGCAPAAGATFWSLANNVPTNLTVSGSSYSLQAYNFVCQ